MRTLSVLPIRETLRRYTYDARSGAPEVHVDDQPQAAPVNPVGMERLKSGLRRIPILAPAFIAAYRLIKMPSRIALLLLRVENVLELLASISRQHKFAASRIQALESTLSEASRDIQMLSSRSDRMGARQEEIFKALSDSSRTRMASDEHTAQDDDVGDRRRVDVVKIDAEGAEPAILRGMRQVINNNPEIKIFVEFAPQHLVRANVDPRSYLAQIRDQGFEILEVKEPTGELVPATDQALCDCFSVNLMLRKSRLS